MDPKIKALQEKIAEAHLGGGVKRIEKQHQKKKLTARERVLYFLDDGSFEEMGILVTHRTTDFGMEKEMYYGDGVVTGYGTVNGRLVYVYAQDFTVFGGALSETHAHSLSPTTGRSLDQNRIAYLSCNLFGLVHIGYGLINTGNHWDVVFLHSFLGG